MLSGWTLALLVSYARAGTITSYEHGINRGTQVVTVSVFKFGSAQSQSHPPPVNLWHNLLTGTRVVPPSTSSSTSTCSSTPEGFVFAFGSAPSQSLSSSQIDTTTTSATTSARTTPTAAISSGGGGTFDGGSFRVG